MSVIASSPSSAALVKNLLAVKSLPVKKQGTPEIDLYQAWETEKNRYKDTSHIGFVQALTTIDDPSNPAKAFHFLSNFDRDQINNRQERVQAALTAYATSSNEASGELGLDIAGDQEAAHLVKAVFAQSLDKTVNTLAEVVPLYQKAYSGFDGTEFTQDEFDFVTQPDTQEFFNSTPPNSDVIAAHFQKFLIERKKNHSEKTRRYVDVKKLRTLQYRLNELYLMRKRAEQDLSVQAIKDELILQRLLLCESIRGMGYDLGKEKEVKRFSRKLYIKFIFGALSSLVLSLVGVSAGVFYSYSFISHFAGADGNLLIDAGYLTETARTAILYSVCGASIALEVLTQIRKFNGFSEGIFKQHYPRDYQEILERAKNNNDIRESIEYVKAEGELVAETYFARLVPETTSEFIIRILVVSVLFIPMILNSFATALFVLHGWSPTTGSVATASPIAALIFFASSLFNYSKIKNVQDVISKRRYKRIVSENTFFESAIDHEARLEKLRNELVALGKDQNEVAQLDFNKCLLALEAAGRLHLLRPPTLSRWARLLKKLKGQDSRHPVAIDEHGHFKIETVWDKKAWHEIQQKQVKKKSSFWEWAKRNPGAFTWGIACILIALVLGSAIMAIKMIHFPEMMNALANEIVGHNINSTLNITMFFITIVLAVLPTQFFAILGNLKKFGEERETIWERDPDNKMQWRMKTNHAICRPVDPDIFSRLKEWFKCYFPTPAFAKLLLASRFSQQFITTGLMLLTIGVPGILFGWTPPGAIMLALAITLSIGYAVLYWPDAHGNKKLTAAGRAFFRWLGDNLASIGNRFGNDRIKKYGSRMISEVDMATRESVAVDLKKKDISSLETKSESSLSLNNQSNTLLLSSDKQPTFVLETNEHTINAFKKATLSPR